MAAMTTADLTIIPLGSGTTLTGAQSAQEISAPGRVRRQFKVTFPNGTTGSDYPAGGIPIDKTKLGARNVVLSLKVLGRIPAAGATNPMYEWNGDPVTPKIVSFVQGGAAAGAAMQESALTAVVTNSQQIFIDVECY